MNITQAHEAGIKALKKDPTAVAVTIEFVSQTTGLTKFLRVWRSDKVEVMNTLEEAES